MAARQLKTKLLGSAGIAGALALLLFSMSLQLKLLRALIVVPALALSWAGTAVVWQDWPDTEDEAKQCVDDAKGVELIIAPITCTVQGLLGVADVITHSKTVSVAAAAICCPLRCNQCACHGQTVALKRDCNLFSFH